MCLDKRQTLYWGLVDYTVAFHKQLDLVEQRKQGIIPDTLVLLQHPPTITIGRRQGAHQHLLWSAEELYQKNIQVCETNRGGDITYHGPGQLVGYAIMDLQNHKDLHSYLRRLEAVVIAVLEDLGLAAQRRPNKTGVWIKDKKIAALGVAVKSWISYHGFAINVNNDLSSFKGIVPCGIEEQAGGVTSIKEVLGHDFTVESLEPMVHRAFWKIFQPC